MISKHTYGHLSTDSDKRELFNLMQNNQNQSGTKPENDSEIKSIPVQTHNQNSESTAVSLPQTLHLGVSASPPHISTGAISSRWIASI